MDKNELESRLNLDGEYLYYEDNDGEQHQIAFYSDYVEGKEGNDVIQTNTAERMIKGLIEAGHSLREIYRFNKSDLNNAVDGLEIWCDEADDNIPYLEQFNYNNKLYEIGYQLELEPLDDLEPIVLQELSDYFTDEEIDRDYDKFRDDIDGVVQSRFQMIIDESERDAKEALHQEIHSIAEDCVINRNHPFNINDIDFKLITNPKVVQSIAQMTEEYDSSAKILRELSPELILQCQGYFDSETIDQYFYWNKFEELVEDNSLRNSRDWFLSEHDSAAGQGFAGPMTIRLASTELLQDKEFVLEFLKREPSSYEFIPKELRDMTAGEDPIKALSSIILKEKIESRLSEKMSAKDELAATCDYKPKKESSTITDKKMKI